MYDQGSGKVPKIFYLSALYPDAQGNLYCNVQNHFLTRLDKNGDYRYILNFMLNNNLKDGVNSSSDFTPTIFNPVIRNNYSTRQVHQMLPGMKINYPLSYIDAETNTMYTKEEQFTAGRYIHTLRITDISLGIETGLYVSQPLNIAGKDLPYISASLNRFNGGLVRMGSNDNPLPLEGKLIGLYFTDAGIADAFYDKYKLPTLCEIDLEGGRALRYAPGRLVTNGFDIGNGQLLGSDAEGMLYMLATKGGNTVVVKTVYVEE